MSMFGIITPYYSLTINSKQSSLSNMQLLSSRVYLLRSRVPTVLRISSQCSKISSGKSTPFNNGSNTICYLCCMNCVNFVSLAYISVAVVVLLHLTILTDLGLRFKKANARFETLLIALCIRIRL